MGSRPQVRSRRHAIERCSRRPRLCGLDRKKIGGRFQQRNLDLYKILLKLLRDRASVKRLPPKPLVFRPRPTRCGRIFRPFA